MVAVAEHPPCPQADIRGVLGIVMACERERQSEAGQRNIRLILGNVPVGDIDGIARLYLID